jgi:hypothetical protein
LIFVDEQSGAKHEVAGVPQIAFADANTPRYLRRVFRRLSMAKYSDRLMRGHEYNRTRSPAVSGAPKRDDAIGSAILSSEMAKFGEGRRFRDDVIGGKDIDQRIASWR